MPQYFRGPAHYTTNKPETQRKIDSGYARNDLNNLAYQATITTTAGAVQILLEGQVQIMEIRLNFNVTKALTARMIWVPEIKV